MSDKLESVKERLRGLQELLNEGLISRDDFDREKALVLVSFRGTPSTAANKPPQQQTQTDAKKSDDQKAAFNKGASANGISVSLERDEGDPYLVRCGLKLSFAAANGGASDLSSKPSRRRILVLLLDRSGSMSDRWDNVVESVRRFVTPEMLTDPNVALRVIVYAVEADRVQLDGGMEGLIRRLQNEHRPRNQLTCFRSAFRAATAAVSEVLASDSWKGFPSDSVDAQVLLFTDGCDTSLGDVRASAASAQQHYDAESKKMTAMVGSLFVFVAAFGADHDVKQCQAMGHRYVYVDRVETLSERLSGVMGEMMSGTGFCQLVIALPKGLALYEPVPDRLPLDGTSLEYEFFISRPRDGVDGGGSDCAVLHLEATSVGYELLECDVPWTPSVLARGSFAQYRFFIDRAAAQLRLKAATMTGRATSQDIADLRALLDLVRRDVDDARRAACSVQRGGGAMSEEQTSAMFRNAITTCKFGGAAGSLREKLRAGLAVVDTLADRLSHVVGEHERGMMTDARVNAILGDSRQHVPAAVKKQLDRLSITNAERIKSRREIAAGMPPPPADGLSTFGREFTRDVLSCCNAHEVAADGDAHFFYMTSLRADGAMGSTGVVFGASDGDGFVSYESFYVMKQHAVKQGGDLNCTVRGVATSIAALWLPCYFTESHFRRAVLLVPDAIGLAMRGDPLAYQPSMMPVVFDLFARSCIQIAPAERKEIDWVVFLHKLRAFHAFVSYMTDANGTTLLDVSRARLASFLSSPAARKEPSQLLVVVSDAILALESVSSPVVFRRTCAALFEETLRRNIGAALKCCRCDESLEVTALLHGALGFSEGSCSPAADPKSDARAPFSRSVERAFAGRVVDVLSDGQSAAFCWKYCQSFLSSVGGKEGDLTLDGISSLFALLCTLGRSLESCGGLAGAFAAIDSVMASDDATPRKIYDSLVEQLKRPDQVEVMLSEEQMAACIVQAAVLHSDGALVNSAAAAPLESCAAAFPSSVDYRESCAARIIQSAFRARRISSSVSAARRRLWKWRDPVTQSPELLSAMRFHVARAAITATAESARALREVLAKRRALLAKHPVAVTKNNGMCWCGERFTVEHAAEVWGNEATVDDPELYREARTIVLRRQHHANVSLIDAATEKQYRTMGGTFTFGVGDTFIRGMHRRTVELMREWKAQGKVSKAKAHVSEAVAELLLRLKWDDRDRVARRNLTRIMEFLWLALSGNGPTVSTIPSCVYDL